MRRGYWISGIGCAVFALFAYTQLTIFVVQPIGAVPEGRTIVLWRKSRALAFIDSADGVCKRYMNGVSLLCRGMTTATIAENNPILLRLPYSPILYSVSTNGERYEE